MMGLGFKQGFGGIRLWNTDIWTMWDTSTDDSDIYGTSLPSSFAGSLGHLGIRARV